MELNKKGVHLRNWNKVCMPQTNGGFGIKIMEYQNTAILEKIEWRFLIEPHNFWVRVLKAKYGVQGDVV